VVIVRAVVVVFGALMGDPSAPPHPLEKETHPEDFL
jgi:hypothetical protein